MPTDPTTAIRKPLNIRIPKKFSSPEYIEGLSFGLSLIATGEIRISPTELETHLAAANNGGGIQKRLPLTPSLSEHLKLAQQALDTKSQAKTVTAGLVALSVLPAWQRRTKL